MPWGMRLPDNFLPHTEYEDVKIVNKTTDIIFKDSYGKRTVGMAGDIVLHPKKYTFRKKFEAKHWFGNWDLKGTEWEKEVKRLAIRYGGGSNIDEKTGKELNKFFPLWEAIKNHTLYIEGCTDTKDYVYLNPEEFNDDSPQFSINEDEGGETLKYVKKQQTNQEFDLEELDKTVDKMVTRIKK